MSTHHGVAKSLSGSRWVIGPKDGTDDGDPDRTGLDHRPRVFRLDAANADDGGRSRRGTAAQRGQADRVASVRFRCGSEDRADTEIIGSGAGRRNGLLVGLGRVADDKVRPPSLLRDPAGLRYGQIVDAKVHSAGV